jgi:hypothetical protein
MKSDDLKPWLMPDETVEALELMEETAERLRGVAEFASLRKELRAQLLDQASKLANFIAVTRNGVADSSLFLALDMMARDKKTIGGSIGEIMEALEVHVSTYNRRKV